MWSSLAWWFDQHECSLCNVQNNLFFCRVKVKPILFAFSAGGDFLSLLQCPSSRKKQSPDHIEDVYDGKVYKERFGSDGYFTGTQPDAKASEVHISLQMNTDGVALLSHQRSRHGQYTL